MKRDGTGVFLGCSMNHSVLWPIPQPRARPPVWFPDFLEMLSQMRLDDRGDVQLVPNDGKSDLTKRIAATEPTDEYVLWARRVMGK